MLETIATTMTEYENHRAADHHEESLAQKVFILNSITNYLPLLLTAFIYVPFGDCIIPVLQQSVDAHLGREIRTQTRFLADPDRLRNEVIAFTLTGQIANAFEELVYPWLKALAKQWWRDRQAKQNDHDDHTEDHTKLDSPSRATFLRWARDQATRPAYNVQDDNAEMVIQFGYLALFSPVWPLVPVGLFINNWIELRSDFLKICVDHQRPAPIRSDGIGPWVASLESLTWLGSISSAAIVHLFGSHRYLADFCDLGTWASLPITILLSEHMFMGFRAAIRFALSHMGSEQTRKEHAERYAERKKFSDELEAHRKTEGHIGTTGKKRHHRVMINEADISGVAQFEDSASEQACIDIIKAAKSAEETRVTGRWKFK
jgi:anoctamin-10